MVGTVLMRSISDCEPRRYDAATSAVFHKTREAYGGLSNMAAGFPLIVNGIDIRTSEALYQICRFPHIPEVQLEILAERSPMTAKMRSKPWRHETRADWMEVRVRIMRWTLRVKLVQNWESFSKVLFETGDRYIVEKKTKRADFWGAQVQEDGSFYGKNVLGRLLMEIRDQANELGRDGFLEAKPLNIEHFELLGEPIRSVKPVNKVQTQLAL